MGLPRARAQMEGMGCSALSLGPLCRMETGEGVVSLGMDVRSVRVGMETGEVGTTTTSPMTFLGRTHTTQEPLGLAEGGEGALLDPVQPEAPGGLVLSSFWCLPLHLLPRKYARVTRGMSS